ncbi:MAG: 4'-phosphopantetheinyl transferase superfamily protein [Archangium sp.]|nr:4'-phosphopantetheinyl transferase superfamily protein [Archangium sp.]
MLSVTVLEPSRAPLAEWLEKLSGEEQTRAARFKFEADRAAFIATHGLLRAALLERGVEPQFAFGPHGKPRLVSGAVHFNVSHCRELIAVAISDREVGVDVEPIAARHLTDDVAKRVFGPRELEDLFALEGEARLERFFTRWVLKESWVKATGIGIHDALPSFELEIGAGDARVISGEAESWRFAWWTPMANVKLALCVDGDGPVRVEPTVWTP